MKDPRSRIEAGAGADRGRLVEERLRSERLAGAALDGPEAVVRWLGAVQAQDYAAAKWAVAQRAKSCGDADVEAALDRGAILRTHVMRPTWHFVAPADIRWLLRLTAPRVHAVNATYYRKVGLDDAEFARGDAALAKALQGGRHLTRTEVDEALRAAGLATDGLRLVLLIMHAELDGVICSGARRGKQHTYAALEERIAPVPARSREEALVELARRYFTSHGPAQPQDFAWWSGLKLADAVAAIQMSGSALETARSGAQTYWRGPARAARRSGTAVVRLLPSYDEYLIAIRDHTPFVDARLAGGLDALCALGALGSRGGVFHKPVVIANGRIVGGWRRALGKAEVVVEAKLLVSLDDGERAALEAEVQRYGRYLGLRARLRTREPRRGRATI